MGLIPAHTDLLADIWRWLGMVRGYYAAPGYGIFVLIALTLLLVMIFAVSLQHFFWW